MRQLLLIMLGVVLGSMVISAQARPTIVVFEASNTENMTIDAIDAGEAEITLTWFVANLGNNQAIRLDAYRLNGWERVFPATDVLLADDERVITVLPTLNFHPPTYRLAVVDVNQQIISERLLTIPYTMPEADPRITTFEGLSVRNFTEANLTQGNARVDVRWQVENRVPGSNLIFDQVLPDNTSITVELPRENLWVSSSGQGVVAPRASADGQIRIRLSLVDVRTNVPYDQAFITIAPDGTITSERVEASQEGSAETTAVLEPSTPPTERQPVDCATVTPAQVPLIGYPGDGCHVFTDAASGQTVTVDQFTSSVTLAPAQATIPLSWQVSGAQNAIIEMYSLADLEDATTTPPALSFEDLPPNGAASISIPEDFTMGVRLVMWAVNPTPNNPNSRFARLSYAILDLPATADQAMLQPMVTSSQTVASTPATQSTAAPASPTRTPAPGEIPPTPSPISIVFASYQPFENGAMFYRDDFKEVTILYADGTAVYYPQARYRDLPDNMALFPPQGLFSPLGRFGKVWASDQAIQDTLGWATALEQSYQATVERITDPSGIRFHIQLPDGSAIILDSDSWEPAS